MRGAQHRCNSCGARDIHTHNQHPRAFRHRHIARNAPAHNTMLRTFLEGLEVIAILHLLLGHLGAPLGWIKMTTSNPRPNLAPAHERAREHVFR